MGGEQGVLTMLRLFGNIIRLMHAGVLTTPAGPSYPLEEWRTAVQQAERPGHPGKVLLRLG